MSTSVAVPTRPLRKRLEAPRSRNLVFTSAGDSANILKWLVGRRDFDLWVCYYGEVPGRFENICDYYLCISGGKFPNLKYCYQNWREILGKYDSVFVADDDLIISGKDISTLFDIRKSFDLLILQPAFDFRGKISHRITREHGFILLRYTNFVEVTCPLFERRSLFDFLDVYESVLVGWGVDWWYVNHVRNTNNKKIAIVDAVTCINPHDDTKIRGREIDRLQSTAERANAWEAYKCANNMQINESYITYGFVKSELDFRMVYRAARRFVFKSIRKWIRAI